MGNKKILIFKKLSDQGFPGGSEVENLPAKAGDTGLIADPGKSYMMWRDQVCAPQLFSLCSGAGELQRTLKLVLHNERRQCNESPCTSTIV